MSHALATFFFKTFRTSWTIFTPFTSSSSTSTPNSCSTFAMISQKSTESTLISSTRWDSLLIRCLYSIRKRNWFAKIFACDFKRKGTSYLRGRHLLFLFSFVLLSLRGELPAQPLVPNGHERPVVPSNRD